MKPQDVALTPAQRDRANGAVVGMAVGNALGAGYAFEPRPRPEDVQLRGGGLGPYAAGEWVDDMAMAMPLLEVLASGAELCSQQAQDQVAARWVHWRATTDDVAPIIADVLNAYDPFIGAESLRAAAATMYAATKSNSAGNASLMRTTPITLGYLDDPDGLAFAARLYSDLTHGNPEAGDACVLWNLAQRHAILNGEFDVVVGLPWIPEHRQALWARLITQAEVGPPEDFAVHNSWVSQVLQTAWSAINHCAAGGPEHLEQTLRTVVASGGDTATAAAVAGGLLGARWGISAIPVQWRRQLFGWPGYRDMDLQRDVYRIIERAPWPLRFYPGVAQWPVVAHPQDPGLLLGGISTLVDLPADVDVVVSLCQVGSEEAVPSGRVRPQDHVQVWLHNSDRPEDNPNLRLVVNDTVDMIANFRASGSTVYLHCDDATSRTPFIAAVYAAETMDASAMAALMDIQEVLPHARPNEAFERYLYLYG